MKKLLLLVALIWFSACMAQSPTYHRNGVVFGTDNSGDPVALEVPGRAAIYWNGTKFRKWDGSTWSDLIPESASELSDLTDVNSSTPTDKHFLIADGVDWESRFATISDIFMDSYAPISYSPIGGTNLFAHWLGIDTELSSAKNDISDLNDAFNDLEFITLPDTPANYSGSEDYYVKVNSGGTGLEFAELQTSETEIIITEKSQLINQVLLSDKNYLVATDLTLLTGEYIEIPAGGLTLNGYGFNISSISKNVAGQSIFTSPVGGSGDFISGMILYSSGDGSVFDIVDSDGSHAIELNDVNFIGCASLGEIDDYRQFTGTTNGFYSCDDGFTLSGSWTGFKLTNSNVFGFDAAGTFFKEGTGLTFSNRFFANVNVDFPTGAVLCDFQESNFLDDELFQINSTIAKLNSVLDITNADALIPNISVNSSKSLWTGNIGLPDTAIEVYQEDAAVTGTYEIDWRKDTYNLTLTGDTTFSESNLPASGKNTQEIKIYLTGEYVPTFPANWLTNKVGSYKGSDVNEITVKFVKTGVYFVKISNSFNVYPQGIFNFSSPTSVAPSITSFYTIYGGFFTPSTEVEIEGHTVNNITFISQEEIKISVTTAATEGNFDITINNGNPITYEDAFIVSIGTVLIPDGSDYVSVPADITANLGELISSNIGSASVLTLRLSTDFDIADGENFIFEVQARNNTNNVSKSIDYTPLTYVKLKRNSDDSTVLGLTPHSTYYDQAKAFNNSNTQIAAGSNYLTGIIDESLGSYKYRWGHTYRIQRINGVKSLVIDGVTRWTITEADDDGGYFEINMRPYDLKGIKLYRVPD